MVISLNNLKKFLHLFNSLFYSGTVLRRWKHLRELTVSDVEIVFKANHIHVSDDRRSNLYITQEIKEEFQDYWKSFADRPLEGRNHILSSFCPEVTFSFRIINPYSHNLFTNLNFFFF